MTKTKNDKRKAANGGKTDEIVWNGRTPIPPSATRTTGSSKTRPYPKPTRTATVTLDADQQKQLSALGKWTRIALAEKRRRSDQRLIQGAFEFGLEQLLEINETDGQP